MSDKETLSKKQRAELCEADECKEHGDGDGLCPVPLYKEDLMEALEDANSKSTIQDAEPKTATGIVTRSE